MFSGSVPSLYIQVGTPRVTDLRGRTVCDLQDAIVEMFASPTEVLIIFKYDVGDHIVILLEMLSKILSQRTGKTTEILASNDLLTTWALDWSDDEININATWNLLQGGVESVNTHCRSLSTKKSSFLSEWAILLRVIICALDRCAVEVEEEMLVQLLHELCSQIEGAYRLKGYLYS